MLRPTQSNFEESSPNGGGKAPFHGPNTCGKPWYHSMDPEYVTGQINNYIPELLLRRFSRMIFAPYLKS